MALKKCKECGKDVSDKAATCPNCGAPIPKPWLKASGCLIILVGFFVVLTITVIMANHRNSSVTAASSSAEPAMSQPLSNLTYEQIDAKARKMSDMNFEEYAKSLVGQRVKWTGFVTDVKKETFGDCEVMVDMDRSGVQDVYVDIDCKRASEYDQRDKITFEGPVTSVVEMIGLTNIHVDGDTTWTYDK